MQDMKEEFNEDTETQRGSKMVDLWQTPLSHVTINILG
jgi:hypothetical protein